MSAIIVSRWPSAAWTDDLPTEWIGRWPERTLTHRSGTRVISVPDGRYTPRTCPLSRALAGWCRPQHMLRGQKPIGDELRGQVLTRGGA